MLKQQSVSLHGTDLCHLLVCDNHVASSYMINSKRSTVSKASNSESRISSWCLAGFFCNLLSIPSEELGPTSS